MIMEFAGSKPRFPEQLHYSIQTTRNMSKKNQEKSDFIKLFLRSVEQDSGSKEQAREFLASEGVNVERMLAEGLQRIKQMQWMIDAKRTEEEMLPASLMKQRAE